MNRPKVLKFRAVKRLFASFGIRTDEGKVVGHQRRRHPMLVHPDGRRFPIPAHSENDDIYRTYIEAARRAFSLTSQHGVSDEEFYGRL